MSADFLTAYLERLKSRYPSARAFSDLDERFATLISPAAVDLPQALLTRIENFVQTVYSFAHSEEFQAEQLAQASREEREILQAPIRNASALMAYDFHYTPEDDQLSLIEINTNGSGFLIVENLYDTYTTVSGEVGPWPQARQDLRDSFYSEWALGSGLSAGSPAAVPPSPLRVAIVDENIPQQKMRVEFGLYDDFFRSLGWQSEIVEAAVVEPSRYDLVYNRHTDFIFSTAVSKKLRESYLTGRPIYSPNPREYLLLAAKERLIDFALKGVAPQIIPPVFAFRDQEDTEDIWARRKNLFFKPMRSFGSKGAYRGSSISRKMFHEIAGKDYLAQEFRPAGGLEEDWKFDLRFYAYRDRIQLGVARVYKGQVTNMSSAGGGFRRLKFT